MRNLTILLSAALCGAATPAFAQPTAASSTAAPQSADARLKALYQAYSAWAQKEGGYFEDSKGENQLAGHLQKVDPATQESWARFEQNMLDQLNAIPADSLSPDERVNAGVLRAILLSPWVVSAVAASYVWKWLYHSDFGVIGAALVQLGLADRPPNFIDNINTVLPSLIVVNVWKEFSFAMIMLMAGLQTVPDQLLRAARVDGASTWQRFWHVTFPHLRGVSTVTLLLLAVQNFNSFIIPWIMTGGGPSNASHIWITHIYALAFGRQRWGVASAYSVLLFIIMMTLGYFYVRALSRGDAERQGG